MRYLLNTLLPNPGDKKNMRERPISGANCPGFRSDCWEKLTPDDGSVLYTWADPEGAIN